MATDINPINGKEEKKKNLLNVINGGIVSKQPHALMMPYPAQGHVNPLMNLAKKLASQGVTITFINSQYIHDRLMKTQDIVGKITVLGHDVMPTKGGDDDGWHEHEHVQEEELCVLRAGHEHDAAIRMMGIPDGVSAHDHIFHKVGTHCEALLHDMPARLLRAVTCLQPPVTCVIADVYSLVCTHAVATRLSVPHVGFWTQSAASYATQMLMVQDPAKFRELMAMNSESNDQSSLTITCIPGAPPMKPCEINTFLKPCDPSDFIFSFIMRSFTLALQCSHILLHTYDTLEVEGLAFIQSKPNILTIGPLLPTPFLDMIKTSSCNHYNLCNHHEKLEASSLWVENGKCLAWLDSQDPSSVLYLSFGSIAIMSDQQMAELMDALEATRYPILMVARDTNTFVEDKDLHDKITSMNSGKMMVVKWAPQLKVLGHPAIGGFLTHCGWNSTFEAICKGVPMLCWPFFCDQMLNCRCIVDSWKIGVEFHKDEVSGLVDREEIKCKVKYLMDPSSGKAMRGQARMLSVMAKEAYNGSSKDNLDSFVKFLHK